MLSAFGAHVTKVERPPRGDWTRWAQPQLPGLTPPESGALYLYNNMGKDSVIIDWTDVEGMAGLRNLIRGADVLIDDWTPQAREELGLSLGGFGDLTDSLIDLSITTFGLSGPYAQWSSTPLVSLALGGYLYLSGDESREPMMLPGYQSEYLAGLQGYAGVMLALGARDETGRGRPVEISEMETLVSLHQITTVMQTYHGVVRRRAGVRSAVGHPGIAGYPMTTLPCKDGYVTFAVAAPQQWDLLCVMIGREDLLHDPRYEDFADLRDRADEIDTILLDWMRDKTRHEIVDLAGGTWSVPASPVLALEEVVHDPQYLHRGLFDQFQHPHGRVLTFPTAPFLMSKTPPRFGRAPSLGEHNSTGKVSFNESAHRSHYRNGRKQLLDGVRVLDLTRVWAGPLTTRILADFGAEVIKVLDPRVPIDRTFAPNNKLNRNKSNLALRLDEPDGRSLFLELASISDVVVESFRPRVMNNFNLGYDVLRAIRPDIIFCSLSGYGSTGEYADYPAYGTSVESLTGIPSLMGYRGEGPMPSGIAYPDPVGALNAVAAVLTALRHRNKTGEGQSIDVALSEGPVSQIGELIGSYRHSGVQPERLANGHHDWAPHGVYESSGEDRWIAIAITNEAQWQSLCEAMGRTDLATDDRFCSASARKANEPLLDRMISEWTKDVDSVELMNDLQSRGIPAGAVYNNRDLLNDPHLKERGFFVELDEHDFGPKTYPGQPIRTPGLDPRRWTPSARLGEHKSEILDGLLGLSSSTLSTLERNSIIGTFPETPV